MEASVRLWLWGYDPASNAPCEDRLIIAEGNSWIFLPPCNTFVCYKIVRYGVPGFDSLVVWYQERARKLIGEKIIKLIPMSRFQEAA